MTAPAPMHREQEGEDAGCPGRGKLLRDCSSCGHRVNRVSDPHVIVMPTWKRCNDLLCRECFSLIMRSAATVIQASQRGAVLYVQEPLGQVGMIAVELGE